MLGCGRGGGGGDYFHACVWKEGSDGQLHIKKYGSREGNEAQSKEETVCLFSVFKRVLNVVLTEMANLIM